MAMPLQPKRQRLNHKSTNKSSLDHHLESVLALSDPSVPFDLSLERILESRILQSDKEHLIHVASRVGSALLDAANRSARKLAAAHNSSIWPLPPELTVQVLSFLDTTSFCYASATCTTFNRCARDPLCYANIDLVNGPKVVNSVVSTMIQRAGKNLKSLKLGTCSIFDSEGNRDMNWHESLLTRSCLGALSFDNGASGALLQKLCLHNIDDMDTHSLALALSDCQSLIDLEIVGIGTVDLERTLTAVSDHCPLIERFCFEYPNSGVPPDLDVYQFDDSIQKCNMLSSIAIRGYILYDFELCKLIKGLPKLKHADFSSSIDLEGFFLEDLGNGEGGDSLETLILRDCESFLSAPIGRFFSAILAGNWKSLRFLDVSSNYETICGVEVLNAVKELRPEICLIAEFKPPKDMNDTSSSSSDEDAQNGDKQEINSSSDDEDSPNGDEPNSDSSSQNLVTQNDSSSNDSSSEDEVTQIGDEPNSDSSSEDEVTQIGDEPNSDSSEDEITQIGGGHNLDSSSGDEVQDH